MIFEFENNNNIFIIKLMDNNDAHSATAYMTLFNDCFGTREHLDIDWYYWFFTKNPLGNCNNYVLYEKNKNEMVGAFAFSPLEYCYNQNKIIGKLAVNGMINKNYTKRGLYSILIQEISKSENRKHKLLFSFPHGDNKPSSKGHLNANWNFNQRCYFYSKKNMKLNKVDEELLSQSVESLQELDFTKFNIGKEFYFCRNYEWINWRYSQRPKKKYYYLISRDENGSIYGYMILGIFENRLARRCQIVDFLSLDDYSFNDLLKLSENVALKEKCSILDIMISEFAHETQILTNYGFMKTNEYYELLIYGNTVTSMIINPLLGDFDAV